MTDNTDNGRQAGPDLASLRQSRTGRKLHRADLAPDPVAQFGLWLGDACAAVELDPNAMTVATVDADHRPATRTVLLKYFDERGFVFFTNLGSNKAKQIAGNQNVSLLFFWRELGRQVSIRGVAERVSNAEALKYFMTRPRGSQIGAWVSAQSSIIKSRSILEAKVEEISRKFRDRDVSLPDFWGGYRVVPREFEFWQGRSDRLHDRFRYLPEGEGWKIDRLAP
jgi:pyridoxamine 5'-phosphate oxidase